MFRFSRVLPGALTAFAAAMLVLSSCSPEPISGGGGTEGGNTVAGVFIFDDGSASAKVKVLLIPSDYNPGMDHQNNPVVASVTASDGSYSFNHASQGSYSIEAADTASGKRSLITEVDVSGADIRIPVDTLRRPGAIKVFLPANADAARGYVYVPGTTMYARLADATRYIVVKAAPAKLISEICYATTSDPTPVVLENDFQVVSGDTAVVGTAKWNYTRRLYLNTTAAGAGVSQNVEEFPVVIRLTKNNFDFTQAKSDGSDIRFARSDTIRLPYEIERWDPVAGLAEVWVKVDTIFGNDSMQYIAMRWGASTGSATSLSNGAAVFDTAAGFEGVWHLGDSAETILDATGNGYYGTRNGNQARVAGTIGSGQYYDGLGDYTDMGNVCNPDTSGFTVCAWIKQAVAKKRQTIVSKSRGGLPSSSYGWLITLDETGALQAFAASDTGVWGDPQTFVLTSKTVITDTVSWHHVAVVYNRSGNNNCRLFIDGADVTIPTGGDITKVRSIVNSAPLSLGPETNGATQWKGALDECSVSFRIRSPDWVRLSYMNQRKDNKLVLFKNE
jgi:hypothetical protein